MSGSKAGARSKEEKGFIETDLPSFSSNENNFFVFDFDRNKGIQCRFGMRGVIAESHYDGGRNMVVMVRGNKRYIINPPSECKSLGIIRERQHPSFRHSLIDWSDVRQSREHGFDGVKAIDTIVRQGEVLYIPSYWFHYIISLQFSAQCNSRSGSPDGGPGSQAEKFLEECGIYSPMGSGKGAIRKKRRHKRKFLSPSF
jgi:hypothetical protein